MESDSMHKLVPRKLKLPGLQKHRIWLLFHEGVDFCVATVPLPQMVLLSKPQGLLR
jgi:hypothetical protein